MLIRFLPKLDVVMVTFILYSFNLLNVWPFTNRPGQTASQIFVKFPKMLVSKRQEGENLETESKI